MTASQPAAKREPLTLIGVAECKRCGVCFAFRTRQEAASMAADHVCLSEPLALAGDQQATLMLVNAPSDVEH